MSKNQTPREYKALPVYITATDEVEGVVEAVVNVFGIIDLGDDRIWNGAYTKTLNERGNQVRVKVLDNHNTGSILNVIGKPLEIREIGRDELMRIAPEVIAQHPEATGGLFTRTQFQLSTPEGVGAFKRLAEGYVTEWSIALDALVTDYETVIFPDGKKKVVRNIRQIRLWEYSPVVFGMNQATVTTDVKNASEVKQGALASKLEANMRMGYAYCVNDWLAYGIIDPETITLLDGAMNAAMMTFRQSIPDEIGMAEIEYYSASGGADKKAGRMISARNRQTIEQAMAALQALLDAADANQADESEEVELQGNSQAEPKVQPKASTGPEAGELSSDPTPSIAAAESLGSATLNTVSLSVDPAEIERELAELSLMMEMTGHELQGDH